MMVSQQNLGSFLVFVKKYLINFLLEAFFIIKFFRNYISKVKGFLLSRAWKCSILKDTKLFFEGKNLITISHPRT